MPEKQGNWFSRNWKWLIPVAVLSPILLCGGAITLFLTVVFGAIRNSGAFTEAMERARNHPEVRQALGQPIEAGYFVSGQISTGGGSGDADLSIPLSGPDGSGTLTVEASHTGGPWQFQTLRFSGQNTNQSISLLNNTPTPPNIPNTQPLP